MTIRAGLRNLDPALEEASRGMGYGPWQTFRRVTLPALRPAIAAGVLLVALYVLSDFGAVSILRYNSFTRAIYIQYLSSFDRSYAALLSLVLVALTLLLLFGAQRIQGRRRPYYRMGAGAARSMQLQALGAWRWPALALCGFVVLAGLIVPLSVVIYWLVRGLRAGEPLLPAFQATFHSVQASTLAALAAIVLALPVAYLAVRFPSRYSNLISQSVYVGYGLPGIVIALSLVFFGANFLPVALSDVGHADFCLCGTFSAPGYRHRAHIPAAHEPAAGRGRPQHGSQPQPHHWPHHVAPAASRHLDRRGPGLFVDDEGVAGHAAAGADWLHYAGHTDLVSDGGGVLHPCSVSLPHPVGCLSSEHRHYPGPGRTRRIMSDFKRVPVAAERLPSASRTLRSTLMTWAQPMALRLSCNKANYWRCSAQVAAAKPRRCASLRASSDWTVASSRSAARWFPHESVHLPPEKRRVGMVFQEYALFPHMTVAENIRFGLHAYAGEKDARIGDVLELVGLQGLGQRMPSELSGGQQQRVALARALAPEPELILLDEPFSNLDAGLRVRVRAEIRAILKQAGATAVFVTHDQEEALSLVDKIAVLMDGRVIQVASPQQLYHQPTNHAVAEFIGDANFLPAWPSGYQADSELGTVHLQYPAQGDVEILIRPENVAVVPGPPDSVARVRRDALLRSRSACDATSALRPHPQHARRADVQLRQRSTRPGRGQRSRSWPTRMNKRCCLIATARACVIPQAGKSAIGAASDRPARSWRYQPFSHYAIM